MPAFDRYIGIDYSGAETPIASPKGLGVYPAEGDGPTRLPLNTILARPTLRTTVRFSQS